MSTLSAVRSYACRRGLRVQKVREGSRDFSTCGPFLLVDAQTNTVVSWRLLDLPDVRVSIDEITAEAESLA